tara:strand:- start:12 stop:140 length:129 start_codon:yes stop_codon:yes gene_type:complete
MKLLKISNNMYNIVSKNNIIVYNTWAIIIILMIFPVQRKVLL